jgi:hypothetical protein
VIGAATLEQGEAWCEEVLGITPQPGGQHPLMGTHNRLFSLASPDCPRAYGEIIAIDPQAPAPGRARWFDLDQPALQAQLRTAPALLHWVARAPDLDIRLAALRALGHDAGELVAAQRATPRGLLRWRISIRPDGRRLCDGALPAWIEWGESHPTDVLPDQGLRLHELALGGVPAAVAASLQVPAPLRLASSPAQPPLVARLSSPRGVVELRSPG